MRSSVLLFNKYPNINHLVEGNDIVIVVKTLMPLFTMITIVESDYVFFVKGFVLLF